MSQHVFISYAHADSEIAHKIATDLEEGGISVWIDVQGLAPGTPNWEQSIRDAIGEAKAVLLIASVNSRQSVYVQGELTVAKTRQCPVYPIWVSGQEWIDCVPFDMVNYQYIDCRAHEYGAGILRILEILGGTKRSVPIPEGFFGVKLPSNQVVTFQHRTFRDVNEFLTQLYILGL
jgi:hypothetical protein